MSSLPPWPSERETCVGCGFSYAATTVPAALGSIAAVPATARAALALVADPAARPSPDAWSAVEVAAHLRDVQVSSTIRLHRVRTEDRPLLEPMLNDLRNRRFRHRALAPDAILDELELVTAGLLDEAGRVTDWTRSGLRQPDEARTARWLLRNAAHEGLHHVGDLRALAG